MIMVVNDIWTPRQKSGFSFAITPIILCFGSFVWFHQSLKWPHCGYKPVWPIMRSAPASEWFVRIVRMDQCPSCQDREEHGE